MLGQCKKFFGSFWVDFGWKNKHLMPLLQESDMNMNSAGFGGEDGDLLVLIYNQSSCKTLNA